MSLSGLANPRRVRKFEYLEHMSRGWQPLAELITNDVNDQKYVRMLVSVSTYRDLVMRHESGQHVAVSNEVGTITDIAEFDKHAGWSAENEDLRFQWAAETGPFWRDVT